MDRTNEPRTGMRQVDFARPVESVRILGDELVRLCKCCNLRTDERLSLKKAARRE